MTTSEPNSKPESSLIGADALVGKTLKEGRYTLVRVLATGGMARIYEAVDNTLERTVAVKVLMPETSGDGGDDTLTIRFKREANAVAVIEHPNIVRIYDYGEEMGVYYIVMNLVRGKDLAQELFQLRRASERMDVYRVIRLLEQTAAALDEAHRNGIIHRDVKPSNILVDEKDRVTLTDFGLLLRPSTDTTFGTAFGTPRYISPEQAIASHKVTPQSDIYSLAIIAYEMLTGKTPFNGDTPMEIALSHIHDLPPSPRALNPSIPEAVEAELLKALDKLPERRHASTGDFIGAVRMAYGMGIDDTPSRPLAAPSNPTRPDAMAEAIATNRDLAEKRAKATPGGSPPPKAIKTPDSLKPPPPKQTDEVVMTANRLAKNWDTVLPKSRTRSARLPLVPILVGVAGVVLVVLILIASGGSGGTSIAGGDSTATSAPPTDALATPSGDSVLAGVIATDTPPPPTATFTPLPPSLMLDYTDSSLTLINTSNVAVEPRRITFRAANDAITEIGSYFLAGDLRAGTCFRIRAQSRQNELPRACAALQNEHSPNVDPTTFFWRVETSPSAFTVLIDGAPALECPSVQRGQTNTCRFELPPLS
ncbi:MAG: protein kinase [bacterium]|nr:protein kinase [bacterium]